MGEWLAARAKLSSNGCQCTCTHGQQLGGVLDNIVGMLAPACLELCHVFNPVHKSLTPSCLMCRLLLCVVCCCLCAVVHPSGAHLPAVGAQLWWPVADG